MRSQRLLLVIAGLLVAVGLALVLFESESVTGYSFGPPDADADGAYFSGAAFAFDGAWLVTQQGAIGYGLAWLGSLLTAGAVGFRVAAGRSA